MATFLLSQAVEKQAKQTLIAPQGPFPIAEQRELGLQAMRILGFDFDGGRLDISAHPFCGGVPQDVRITTRYNENDLLSALFGVIHENRPRPLRAESTSPVGRPARRTRPLHRYPRVAEPVF